MHELNVGVQLQLPNEYIPIFGEHIPWQCYISIHPENIRKPEISACFQGE